MPELEAGRFASVGSGYFDRQGPLASMFGEGVQLLGGGRALLMQIAHPAIAAGVVEHSSFASEPWKRLRRTVEVMQGFVYGDRAHADKMSHALQAMHRHVRGSDEHGDRYNAQQPELMLWVHATFADTVRATYECFYGPLAEDARRRYQGEILLLGELCGLDREMQPQTTDEFDAYLATTLEAGALRVGHHARSLAAHILHPPLPAALTPLAPLFRLTTKALLPSPLADGYELHLSAREARAFTAVRYGFSHSHRLPDRLRRVEHEQSRPLLRWMIDALAQSA